MWLWIEWWYLFCKFPAQKFFIKQVGYYICFYKKLSEIEIIYLLNIEADAMVDDDLLDDEDENYCTEDHEEELDENDENCAELNQTCSIGDMSVFYFSGM